MRRIAACLWLAIALTGCRAPAAAPVAVTSPAAPALDEALRDRTAGNALIGQAGGTLIGQAGGNLVENAAPKAPDLIADASVPAASPEGEDAEDAEDEESKDSEDETRNVASVGAR